jgi:intracellular septation protein
MKFLFDLFPVLLFFIVYKLYGSLPEEFIESVNTLPFLALTPGKAGDAIFLATAGAIFASFIQVSLYWLRRRRFERTHILSLVLISVFGGATLLFQDALFIKWKPTVLNWLFALVFVGSQFIGNMPLAKRMMHHAMNVPDPIWVRLNLAWSAFFFFAGLANIVVAYRFSEQTWVDFKLFGLMGLTLVFVFAQALYLMRYVAQENKQPDSEL